MPLSDLTILLIDDSPAEINLMREALNEGLPDVTIRSIINGAEALEELKRSTKFTVPDAILLDYHMPIMNGLGFLRKIADHDHLSKIPLIVWTGNDDPTIAEACKTAGATLVKTKPSDYAAYAVFAKELGTLAMRAKQQRLG
jgi:CheY-like chemotaxis protein